jgi:molybdenum cofactor biosynthesis enzyme MoaA
MVPPGLSGVLGMPLPKFCASPWAEGVLRMDGKLLTCCKNAHSQGNWLTAGVDAAWLSPEFVSFREKVIAGEYPDELCRVCHSNGTAQSLKQLLQRAIREYGTMLQGAGAVGVADMRHLFDILDHKKPDDRFREVIAKARKRCATWRLHSKVFLLPAHALLFVSKFEKIITVIDDFVSGNPRPSVVAPFRQGNLIAVCNARCIHCPGLFTGEISEGAVVNGGRFKEMPVDDVERAFAREDDIIDFFMNGSEFLFSKAWEDVAKRLQRQGVRVRFSTNGMLLTERNADLLIKNRYLGKLNVSLDGGTKETIEAVRVRVKYDRVMQNLDYLLRLAAVERYSFVFSLSFALMTDNYRTLPDFVDLAARLRDINPAIVPSILVQPLAKKGIDSYGAFFREHHPSLIDHSELRERFESMLARSEALKIPVVVFFTHALADFIKRGCPIPSIEFIGNRTSQLEEEIALAPYGTGAAASHA